MKRIKRVMVLVLSTMLAFAAIPTFASSTSDIQTSAVKQQLHDLSTKTGITITSFESQTGDIVSTAKVSTVNGKILKFKNVAEFEKFVYALQHELPTVSNDALTNSVSLASASVAAQNGTKHWTWYAFGEPYMLGGIAQWKDLCLSYTYQGSKITSVTNVSSSLVGVTAFSWNQQGQSVNLSNGIANVSVSGYYLLGVQIGSFTVGSQIPATWATHACGL